MIATLTQPRPKSRVDISAGLVCGDAAMLRRLKAVLRESGIVPVETASAVESLQATGLDVLILGGLHGEELDAVAIARGLCPDVPLVLVAAGTWRRELRGAHGVVLEANLNAALAPTLRAVAAGQVVYPVAAWEREARPVLSTREKQILGMVVMGFSNGAIASKLHLAESTVKNHLSASFVKLGVRGRNEATALILDGDSGLGTGILMISDDDGKERQVWSKL